MEKITKTELEQVVSLLNDIMGTEGDNSFGDALTSLFNMPDDKFTLITPGILQSFQQSVNNPNDKLGLVQALNANGATAEDLVASFNIIADSIDGIEEISQVKRDFLKSLLATLTNAVNETEGIAKRLVQIRLPVRGAR